MQVIKRDGRSVEFNREKVKNAVLAAFKEVDKEVTQEAKNKASDIASYINGLENEPIPVEKIQDIVEDKLMASKRKDVAKAFILYRNDRSRIRESKTQLMKDITEKLMATNVQNQNANVDEKSFGGRVGEASDAVLKKYALDNCMSEMAKIIILTTKSISTILIPMQLVLIIVSVFHLINCLLMDLIPGRLT